MNTLEQMNLVIVGHVDHGKSTLIGRLLADTDSLPDGKLEQVKKVCEINSKPFEYAFLLDALKDEQSQGITIDSARCFFKSNKRHYIIIDAPGHIEFLKNMVTGAARAEAAILLIDADEGVQENSKRHGYLLSMLGIKQILVAVNKMDLVNYDESVFERVKKEYTAFLKEINVEPKSFIPISAREGDFIVGASDKMPWYTGMSILEHMDDLEKEQKKEEKALRFPLQDIYKFTEKNDDRRIFAGTVQTGTLAVGDDVVFYPSGKTSKVKTIESFNTEPKTQVSVGEATGITLETQIYVKPGEIMCRANELACKVGSSFKAHLFWLGKVPLVKDKQYKLKIGTAQATVLLKDVIHVLDASNLDQNNEKTKVERHDVAECIFVTQKPIAFDLSSDVEVTGRFVIVDDYEIAGGGIITSESVEEESLLELYKAARDGSWVRGHIENRDRLYKHKARVILISSDASLDRVALAKQLEATLFEQGKAVYSMGLPNLLSGVATDLKHVPNSREEQIRRLGEMAHAFTDAGLIFISTVPELDDFELTLLKSLLTPVQVDLVNLGPNLFQSDVVDVLLDEGSSIDDQVRTVVDYLKSRLGIKRIRIL